MSFESCAGFFYIVSMQDEASHARFVATTLSTQAKHDMGLRARESNFKPAFSFAHGLVVYLFKAELVNIKIKSLVLIADAYSNGTNFCEHIFLYAFCCSSVAIYKYTNRVKYPQSDLVYPSQAQENFSDLAQLQHVYLKQNVDSSAQQNTQSPQ